MGVPSEGKDRGILVFPVPYAPDSLAGGRIDSRYLCAKP